MKNIDTYIQEALEALKNSTLGIVQGGKINKTYNGYLSSFGASIITSGLLPTFIFYSKKAKNNSDADRSKILTAIEKMLKKLHNDILPNDENILQKVIAHPSDRRLKKAIEQCAIALKLAIRTYELVDTQKNNTKENSHELEKS